MRCLPILLATVISLGSQSASGQAVGSPAAPSIRLTYVDSRPMLNVTLRAGERTYYCHLLIDLSFPQALLLHSNAAHLLP